MGYSNSSLLIIDDSNELKKFFEYIMLKYEVIGKEYLKYATINGINDVSPNMYTSQNINKFAFNIECEFNRNNKRTISVYEPDVLEYIALKRNNKINILLNG